MVCLKKTKTAIFTSLSLGLFCSNSFATTINVTDVTYAGAYADDAVLVHGNDSVNGINSLAGAYGDGDITTSLDNWTLLDKTDDSSNSYQDLTYTVTTPSSGNDGDFTLAWQNSGSTAVVSPYMLDLIFVTKAGNKYGAYLFSQQTLDPIPGSEDGTFNISWTNNGGNTPDISHISVYGRSHYMPPPVGVNEPTGLLLLSLGLFGVGVLRNKRSKT